MFTSSDDALDARPNGRAAARGTSRRPGQLAVWTSSLLLGVLVLSCFALPLIAHLPSPTGGSIEAANLPMGAAGHIFGTDPVGNDIASRILYGGRVSIEVAILTNLVGLGLGSLIGTVAASFGGVADVFTAAMLNVLIAFPTLVLSLVLASYLGPGRWNEILALSLFTVPSYARLARAQTLLVRERDFIRSAQLCGSGALRIVLSHVLPNVVPRLLTFSYIGLSFVVVAEASLSFLGVGVRPPAASWGDMIAQGQEYLTTNPSLVLIPGLFLVLTVLAVNTLGDGLRSMMAAR